MKKIAVRLSIGTCRQPFSVSCFQRQAAEMEDNTRNNNWREFWPPLKKCQLLNIQHFAFCFRIPEKFASTFAVTKTISTFFLPLYHHFVVHPLKQPLPTMHFSQIPGLDALTKPSALVTQALVDRQQGFCPFAYFVKSIMVMHPIKTKQVYSNRLCLPRVYFLDAVTWSYDKETQTSDEQVPAFAEHAFLNKPRLEVFNDRHRSLLYKRLSLGHSDIFFNQTLAN